MSGADRSFSRDGRFQAAQGSNGGLNHIQQFVGVGRLKRIVVKQHFRGLDIPLHL